jgi:hypothetical protein
VTSIFLGGAGLESHLLRFTRNRWSTHSGNGETCLATPGHYHGPRPESELFDQVIQRTLQPTSVNVKEV